MSLQLNTSDQGQIPISDLELLRVNLSQVTHSLSALLAQLKQANLPAWPKLLQQFNIIATQLTTLSNTLATHSEALQKSVTFPTEKFPTLTHQHLLTTLLRRKNLPEVDEWIEEGNAQAKGINVGKDSEFSLWAANLVASEIGNHSWSGFLTQTEIDNGDSFDTLRAGDDRSQGDKFTSSLQFMSSGKA